MSKQLLNMPVAAVLAAGAAALSGAASNTASAMPLAGGARAQRDGRNRCGRQCGGTGNGGPLAPAFAPAPPPYYYRPSPRYYNSYYDAPPRAYRYDYDYAYDYAYDRYPAPRYGRGAAAYCASRYLSWDPETGTFIGYDGLRHPCP